MSVMLMARGPKPAEPPATVIMLGTACSASNVSMLSRIAGVPSSTFALKGPLSADSCTAPQTPDAVRTPTTSSGVASA